MISVFLQKGSCFAMGWGYVMGKMARPLLISFGHGIWVGFTRNFLHLLRAGGKSKTTYNNLFWDSQKVISSGMFSPGIGVSSYLGKAVLLPREIKRYLTPKGVVTSVRFLFH